MLKLANKNSLNLSMKIFFQKHWINFSTIPFEQTPFQFRRIGNVNVMFVLSQFIEILCRIEFFWITGRQCNTSCRCVRCIWLGVRIYRWQLAGLLMVQRLMIIDGWIQMRMLHVMRWTHVTGLYVTSQGHRRWWWWWRRHAVFIGTFLLCAFVYWLFGAQCKILAFCFCYNVWERFMVKRCECVMVVVVDSRWCGWWWQEIGNDWRKNKWVNFVVIDWFDFCFLSFFFVLVVLPIIE